MNKPHGTRPRSGPVLENKEHVSVILPTRNRERLLRRSIESVLSQQYEDIELIVVDDASSDGTPALVDSFDDSRLVYLRLDDRAGAAAARNAGIAKAKGNLIAFQDSDDVWHPGKLDAQVRALSAASDRAGVCVCSSRGSLFGKTYDDVHEDEEVAGSEVLERILAGKSYGTLLLLVAREALDSVGGFDETLPRLQDYELTLRLARRWNFVFVSDILVDVEIGEDSISSDPLRFAGATDRILQVHSALFAQHPAGHSHLLFRAGKYLALGGHYASSLRYSSKAIRTRPANWKALALFTIVATHMMPVFKKWIRF